ncbi:hypothetical protein BDA99DRAFT_565429 [Phascolomyces articulosus]|uniref:Uncharacterized protein n=1 Tax=Phascolomyces articulosus TaxID=60185 RepID=A0AAD5JN28_9FUNG|nr:hypothetical protein BDA99DRAFT_565429 [Phascolomyces articulosus]
MSTSRQPSPSPSTGDNNSNDNQYFRFEGTVYINPDGTQPTDNHASSRYQQQQPPSAIYQQASYVPRLFENCSISIMEFFGIVFVVLLSSSFIINVFLGFFNYQQQLTNSSVDITGMGNAIRQELRDLFLQSYVPSTENVQNSPSAGNNDFSYSTFDNNDNDNDSIFWAKPTTTDKAKRSKTSSNKGYKVTSGVAAAYSEEADEAPRQQRIQPFASNIEEGDHVNNDSQQDEFWIEVLANSIKSVRQHLDTKGEIIKKLFQQHTDLEDTYEQVEEVLKQTVVEEDDFSRSLAIFRLSVKVRNLAGNTLALTLPYVRLNQEVDRLTNIVAMKA